MGLNTLFIDISPTGALSNESDQSLLSTLVLSDDFYNSLDIVGEFDTTLYEPTDSEGLSASNLSDVNKGVLALEFEQPTDGRDFIIIDPPGLTVGQNINDVVGSTTLYEVGGGAGAINGFNGADKLIGDFGGATMETQTQNYNVVFVMDVSGSMNADSVTGETRLELMVRSVKELMASFSGFEGGEIKVHLTAFSTNNALSGTFTVTDAQGFTEAIALMDSLTHGGYTNYEAGLQDAVSWLQGDEPIENATTTTYFLSDGFPNFAIDDATGEAVNTNHTSLSAMDHVLGVDGYDEVAAIQSLSDEVIGVGISIGDSISNIELIDSDGDALNVPADQLVAVMQETNPITNLASVGDDVINGNEGNDIIFGDAVNTDSLAQIHGLNINQGDGWEVFSQLESGLSTIDAGWNRADTLNYIQNNAAELAAEIVTDQGVTRNGGNDVLRGGSGSDLIYGQEGDDLIIGGLGFDVLSGGSGADTFSYESFQDTGDVIQDFDVTENDALDLSSLLTGYDPNQDVIDDFIKLTEQNGNTIVSVNSNAVVTLEGVGGLDVNDLVNDGNIII